MSDNPEELYDHPREILDDDEFRFNVAALIGYFATFSLVYWVLKRRMKSGKGGHNATLFGLAWLAARNHVQYLQLKREIREVNDSE